MAEKLLNYDRGIVRQDTYYNCGPASGQIVLSARGIVVSEAALGKEMGTHTGGTDYIGLVEKSLDKRVPQAQYTSVYMPNDPPSSAQREKLWNDLVRSINGGWGVVANIVAPPNNYPRAVAPSTQNLRYSGGTVYHYVAIMGYSDEGGRRRVWFADPGFAPYGCWVSFDQFATLVPPKGYAYAAATVPAPSVPAPQPPAEGAIGTYRGAPVARAGAGSNAANNTKQVIVIHDTEGGYEGAISWMINQRNGSYHIIRALAGQGARLVPDSRQAWGAMPTGNRIGLHICLEGYAKWTRAEWLSKGRAGLEGMAHDIAAWSKQYGIPLVKLSPAQVRAGQRGICTHADISAAFRETDHTDPGSGFPLDLVIARAKQILSGNNQGGFLMALNDAEQKELLRKTREIHDQLGPKLPSWGEGSSFGKDTKGNELTLRDGLIAGLRRLEAAVKGASK